MRNQVDNKAEVERDGLFFVFFFLLPSEFMFAVALIITPDKVPFSDVKPKNHPTFVVIAMRAIVKQ